MQRLLVLVLLTALLSGCVTELWGETLPGAYSHPGAPHDVYRIGVIGCDNAVFTLIAVEVPSSRQMSGRWFVIPFDMDLRPWCP